MELGAYQTGVCNENYTLVVVFMTDELSITSFSTVGSVCILELESLLGSTSSGSQGIGEEFNDGSVRVFIARGLLISVQESCHTMAQKLAVPIWSSIIQCLQECGGSIHYGNLGSWECICDF